MTRFDLLQSLLPEAADLALSAFNRQDSEVETKAPGDYVSAADRAVERLIRNRITAVFPLDAVAGEELGGAPTNSYWAIDPIDGTSNFLSGLPIWAISIAYVENGEPVLGGIALPALGEHRVVQAGGGFTPQHGGGPPVAFAVGRNRHWSTKDRQDLEAAIEAKGSVICNLGSCATSLMFCATGRLAGYIEHHVQVWDVAAGALFCQEAGLEVDLKLGKGPAESCIRVGRSKANPVEVQPRVTHSH